MSFHNSPIVQMPDGSTVKRVYVHQQLTIDHFGIHATIKPSGKVVIQSAPKPIPGTSEVEYDEVEIPASLVFKLANLLKDTRREEFVPVTIGAVPATSGK